MPETAEKAVETHNPKGAGPVVLLCEHASNHIPDRYAGLGLTPEQRASHIAWDPGALAVSLCLSEALNAPLVAGCVSRLVYDCNRPPDSPGAMTERSEATHIPGNRGLTQAQRQERISGVYRPFCAAVDSLMDRRKALGLITVLVTVHSFTPVWFGVSRTVELGILHDSDSRLADAMLATPLQARKIQRNAPYGPEDGVTHSLQCHGVARGLPNVMIELRNDLIADEAGVRRLSSELSDLLTAGLATVLKGSAQNA